MDANSWNGDDNGPDLANLSDAEFDELVERKHVELYPHGCPNGCEACVARGCETPLSDEERLALRQANLLADAIRKAATFGN